MNISSIACSQKLPEASSMELQGKEVSSSERIRSVEPEVELVGATGGEGISCVPSVERSSVAVVSARSTIASSQQEKEQKRLYGTYPILPLTQKDLDEVTRKIKKAEDNITHRDVKQKLAGLKVRELIIRMTIGQYDDAVLSKIEEDVFLLRQELYPRQGDNHDIDVFMAGSPMGLWPINSTYTKSLQIGFVRKKREKIDAAKKRIEKSREEDDIAVEEKTQTIITCVSNVIKEIKKAERICGARVDFPNPYPIHLNQVVIDKIKEREPEMYAEAVERGVLLEFDEDLKVSQLELRLFACHQIYGEHAGSDTYTPFNFRYVDLLSCCKEQIKSDLEKGILTSFEVQQLAFIWLYCLSRFSLICLEYKDSIAPLLTPPGSPGSHMKILLEYNKNCFDLIKWAKSNGFLHVADFTIIQRLLSFIVGQPSYSSASNKELLLALVNDEINRATNSYQRRQAYTNLVYMNEIFKDEERFNHAMAAASEHTLYPLFVRIWHDLGVVGKEHRWRFSESLRPECAIEFLVKLGQQGEKLREMKPEMDAAAGDIKGCYKQQTVYTAELASRLVLYYYLINEKQEGDIILEYGNVQCSAFFMFLSLIAAEKPGLAIEFMEAALKKDKKSVVNKESFKILQRLKPHIVPLIGLLYKKRAEDESCTPEERKSHLDQALSYLMGQVSTRRELYLSIAEIQEKLGNLRAAHDCYDKLEMFFKGFPQESYENCQLYGVRQAKERLADLMCDFPEVASAEHEDLSRDITQEEFKKPKKPKIRKKRSSKKLTTKSVEKLSCRAEEAALPSTPRSMKQISDVDAQDEVLAVCAEILTIKKEHMQEEVGEKPKPVVEEVAVKAGTADSLTEEVVERKMFASRGKRYELYRELLLSANIDYDGLLVKHDDFYKEADNATLKLVILQNKMWTLRHKTFNTYALDYESNQRGVSVAKIKTELRLKILDTLFSNIEHIRTLWTEKALPVNWRSTPMIIVESDDFQRFRKSKTIAKRFWIQLGAQFSTIAHVMQDICSDRLREKEMIQDVANVCCSGLGNFKGLYHLFYQCRNCIDPEHQSRIANLDVLSVN